jgi:hypothetical protein
MRPTSPSGKGSELHNYRTATKVVNDIYINAASEIA